MTASTSKTRTNSHRATPLYGALLLAPMHITEKSDEVVTRSSYLSASKDADMISNVQQLEIALHDFSLAIRHYLGVDKMLAVGNYSVPRTHTGAPE